MSSPTANAPNCESKSSPLLSQRVAACGPDGPITLRSSGTPGNEPEPLKAITPSRTCGDPPEEPGIGAGSDHGAAACAGVANTPASTTPARTDLKFIRLMMRPRARASATKGVAAHPPIVLTT